MASTQHTIQTTYAESPLDPRMYVSMLHSGEYPDEISHTISTWVQDQMHNIFKNGLYVYIFFIVQIKQGYQMGLDVKMPDIFACE